MAYEQLAQDIVRLVGGHDNVNSVVHCTTRLRFKLKNEDHAETEQLKNLDGVVTVVKSGGQYQVVIGNAVADVYQQVIKVGGFADGGQVPDDDESDDTSENNSFLDRFIDLISGIFTPALGMLCAAGMIKGFNSLFNTLGWETTTGGTYVILNAIGDSFFYFLPIVLGYSAAKKFKLDPFIGMAIGAALVYPTLVAYAPSNIVAGMKPIMTLFGGTFISSKVYLKFLGIPVVMMSYTSSVIPTIVAVWVASKWNKLLQKIIPTVVKTFLVPLFTVVVVVPLTLLIIGPITSWLSDLISTVIVNIYNAVPVLAGLLLGGFWQVLVIFGLHWGILPIAMLNIQNLHYDMISSMMFGASFAQIGAVLAVTITSKNSKTKSIGWAAFVSGIFGVTEPAIYGVTLPRKKPFVMSCIASGVAGAILGLCGSKAYAMGGMGIFQFPTMINPKGGVDIGFIGTIIAAVVALVLGFVLTMLFAREKNDLVQNQVVAVSADDAAVDSQVDRIQGSQDTTAASVKSEILTAPVNGRAVALKDVPDEVFASEAMGKGIAFTPEDGVIYAPADGEIALVFPSKHAIGLHTDKGADILIHVGMDTVQLNGEHFTSVVQKGDHVKKGDIILKFDIDAIKDAGYTVMTPMVITNSTTYSDVIPLQDGPVKQENDVLQLQVKN